MLEFPHMDTSPWEMARDTGQGPHLTPVDPGNTATQTSCGIPDFRSPTGLYARLKLDPKFAPLDDPQDMFDLQFFRSDPSVFYSFAREIYPSNFVPSACHRFVRLLELEGKLLRNYSEWFLD